jgi:hypothetical protein
MYGEGYIAPTPKEAGEQATKFYTDNALAMERINAAIQKLRTFLWLMLRTWPSSDIVLEAVWHLMQPA